MLVGVHDKIVDKRPRRVLGLLRKMIRLRGILVIWLPFSFNPKTTTTTQFIKRKRGKESPMRERESGREEETVIRDGEIES
ncbi:hypothetical protein Sjap_010075 [Stephania japonica]|uniref:Uncharacterized protein n=1 Tax=Stephania japonica TaxID=461633 RepID=A0AAP0JAZ7_9MAGN